MLGCRHTPYLHGFIHTLYHAALFHQSSVFKSITAHYRMFKNMRFVRDLLTMQTGTIVYLGATFLSNVVFARVLGADGFGVYSITLAFIGTISTFINFGQGASLLVFFAEGYGAKDTKAMTNVLRNFVDVSLVSSVLLIIAAFLSPWLTTWMYGRQDIGFYSAVLFLSAAVDIWNSLPLVLLQATRTIKTRVTLEQAANLSFIALAILSLLLGYGITGIVLSQLLTGLVFLPVSFTILRRHAVEKNLPGIRDVLKARFADTRPYLAQGLLFSVDKSIGNLFPNGMFFLMSFIANPAIVGFCRIAVKFAQLPRSLVLLQVNDLSLTVLSNLKAKGTQTLRMNAAKIIKHTVAVHAAISFGSMLVIPPAMYVLYGPEFVPAIPLTLGLILLSIPISLCVANSAILRLFRKIHFSILAAILIWPPVIAAFFVLHELVGPLTAFAAAFAIAQTGSLSLTVYIFRILLPARSRASA